MINLFRLFLACGSLLMGWLTLRGGLELGFGTLDDVFFGDPSHPWRGAFNIDFLLHMLLAAAWLVWSNANKWLGTMFAVLAVIGGAWFTFAFLLVRTYQEKGNLRRVALGCHAA